MIDFLRAPEFPDENQTRSAQILQRIILAVLSLVPLMLTFVVILPESSLRWVLAVLSFYALGIPLYLMNRRGYTRTASIIFVGGLWALITVLAHSANGIHSVAVVVYLVIIFLSGILLGSRAGIITALVVCCTTLAFALLELTGNLPAPVLTHTPISLWVVHTVLALVVVYLQYLITGSLSAALRTSRSELEERRKIEAALRESEGRYRALVEHSPDGVVVLQEEKVVYLNPSAARILKLAKRSDGLGRSIEDFISPEYKDFLRARRKHMFESATSLPVAEWKLQCADGTLVDVEGMGVSIIFDGAPAILNTFRDITARKETESALRSSEELLAYVFAKSPDAIMVSRLTDGKAIRWNTAFLQQTGLRDEDVRGSCTRDLNIWNNPDDRTAMVQRLREEGEVINCEAIIHHRDGTLRTTLISGRKSLFKGEEIMLSVGRDTTKRDDLEKKLRASEKKYREIYESILEGFVSVDMDGQIIEANNVYLDMLGYTSEEVRVLNYRDITPARWHEFEARVVATEILPRGYSELYEKEYIRKDGTIFPVELRTYLMADASGVPKGMWAFVRDITDRERAEAELVNAKELAENLIQTADAIVVGLDTLGKIRLFNHAAERITGYSREELEGKNWFEMIVPREQYPHIWEIFQRLPAGELVKEFENPIRTKAGEERFIVWRNSEIKEGGTITGSVSFGIDVTERRQIEDALKQSESRLRQVIDLVPHFIFAKNRKGQFILVNKAVADAYGTTVDGLLGKSDADFNPDPHEVEHFLRDDNEVMDSGRPKDIPEEVITDATGRQRYLHSIKIPYRIASGTEDAVLGVSTDITERKLAEFTLRESEEQFRSLAEQSPNMIFINQAGRIVYVNQRCEELMGYSRKEFEDASFDFRCLIVPESRGLIQEAFGRHAQSLEVPPYEYGLLTKKGERIAAIITTKLIQYRNAPAILGIITDISQRKKSETELLFSREQLRNLSNRLQAIRENESRRIAREIHDELGQALTALKMDLSSLEDTLEGRLPESDQGVSQKLLSMSDLIDSAIQSVRKIGSELRPVALDSLGLVAALEWQAGDFMQRTGIRCTWSLPGDDLDIDRERSTAIFRILQESLTNIARHAHATEVKIAFEMIDGTLLLRIEDNGIGIVPADGHKAGSFGILGMRERASLFGGKVSIESGPEKGTILRASIPLDDGMRPATLFPESDLPR